MVSVWSDSSRAISLDVSLDISLDVSLALSDSVFTFFLWMPFRFSCLLYGSRVLIESSGFVSLFFNSVD